jgi:hypothetical protein
MPPLHASRHRWALSVSRDGVRIFSWLRGQASIEIVVRLKKPRRALVQDARDFNQHRWAYPLIPMAKVVQLFFADRNFRGQLLLRHPSHCHRTSNAFSNLLIYE